MTAAQHLLWLHRHGLGYHFECWAWHWRMTLTWPGRGRFIITDEDEWDMERSLRRICGMVALHG